MRAIRFTLQVGLAVIGIASILATGGGGSGGTECSFFSSTCNPSGPPGPIFPYVSLSPSHLTVQVGTRAEFHATTNVTDSRYQWCRMAPGSSDCVPMPQVTGATYTIASASLDDDGSRFQVTVLNSVNTPTSDIAGLSVSPWPRLDFTDGNFAPSDWEVSASVTPAVNGPTYDASRYPTGGNPGAYMRVSYDMRGASPVVRVFHGNRAAGYDPAGQGAIYLVDFWIDCRFQAVPSDGVTMKLLVEQGGRRFAARSMGGTCDRVDVFTTLHVEGLDASAFVLVDGPACATGEACPDFSARGAPIRFGVVTTAESPLRTVQTGHSYDNWILGIWRR